MATTLYEDYQWFGIEDDDDFDYNDVFGRCHLRVLGTNGGLTSSLSQIVYVLEVMQMAASYNHMLFVKVTLQPANEAGSGPPMNPGDFTFSLSTYTGTDSVTPVTTTYSTPPVNTQATSPPTYNFVLEIEPDTAATIAIPGTIPYGRVRSDAATDAFMDGAYFDAPYFINTYVVTIDLSTLGGNTWTILNSDASTTYSALSAGIMPAFNVITPIIRPVAALLPWYEGLPIVYSEETSAQQNAPYILNTMDAFRRVIRVRCNPAVITTLYSFYPMRKTVNILIGYSGSASNDPSILNATGDNFMLGATPYTNTVEPPAVTYPNVYTMHIEDSAAWTTVLGLRAAT